MLSAILKLDTGDNLLNCLPSLSRARGGSPVVKAFRAAAGKLRDKLRVDYGRRTSRRTIKTAVKSVRKILFKNNKN